MAAYVIQTQPQSVTAVPGQNSTFSVVVSADTTPVTYAYRWYTVTGATTAAIAGATSASYQIDPLISDSGKSFFVTVSSSTIAQAMLSSARATLTVNEDNKPFDVYDVGRETGRERHRRLRLLGYI